MASGANLTPFGVSSLGSDLWRTTHHHIIPYYHPSYDPNTNMVVCPSGSGSNHPQLAFPPTTWDGVKITPRDPLPLMMLWVKVLPSYLN